MNKIGLKTATLFSGFPLRSMHRASCAVHRRVLTRVTVSLVRWAAWSAVPLVPASAARWAPFTACSAFPTGIVIAATAIATATAASIATANDAVMTRFRASVLQPVAGLEDPPHHDHAGDQERGRPAEAERDADVGDLVKAPAEAGDQIDHGIEQRDGAPARRQHVDRIEAAAEEGQRRHHQHRDHLRLLAAVGPA